MSDILCPYCFEKVTTKTAYFECTGCNSKLIMPLGVKNGKLPKCPKCKGSAVKRVVLKCGACSNEFPNDIFQYKKYIPFSIVGLSGSGKTNYITTMIQELKTSRCGFDVSAMNSATNNRFLEEKNSIYKELKPSEGTNSGEIIPYQWRIRKPGKMSRLESYCMTIFDGAGEDQTQMMDSDVASYIAASKYVIFLVDPMSLYKVKQTVQDKDVLEWSLPEGKVEEDDDSDASINLAQDMASYIRQAANLKVTRKIEIPIAICFTKIDLLLDQFGQQQITKPSPHTRERKFKTGDANLVNDEIRQYLEQVGEGPFLDSIDMNFKNAHFFGVSSFGNVPIGEKQLNTVEPHRVLDPLMWIFAQEKIIDKD